MPCNEGVRVCRGFAAGLGSSLLLAVVFFVAEELIEACVEMFSFADFEDFEVFAAAAVLLGRVFAELEDFKVFAAAAVPLGRVFAELEAGDIFLEATMLIC
jgi:hypothetical protein